MINEKIRSIYALMEANEEVAAKLAETSSPADAVAILAEYNVNVTVDDLKEMVATVYSDEMSAEMLDMVAGGGKAQDFWWGFCDGMKESFYGLVDFFGKFVK